MNDRSTKKLETDSVTQVFKGAAFRSIGGQLVAVDNVSFTLESATPRIVSLVGESGSGKSTIARILLGLQKPSQGTVRYGGNDIYRLSGDEFRTYRRDVQAVFQDPYGIYNPFYRVDRIFWTAIKKFGLSKSKSDGLARIERSLAAVDLRPEDVLGRYPHQLSGGQRHRIMLARVHMLEPAFIIADEPISMLDAAVRVLFLNILLDFKKNYGMTTLFITHDLSTAYYLGGDIMVISDGRVVEQGSVDDVMIRPAHPYTQLLLSSLPSPDPDARWKSHVTAPEESQDLRMMLRDRCLFSDRCPYVMERCWNEHPQMYPITNDQTALCLLYDSKDATSANTLQVARERVTEEVGGTSV